MTAREIRQVRKVYEVCNSRFRKMKRQATSMQIILGIVLGIGIGAGVALVLGSGGLWLAVGLAIGVAIGAAMSRKNKDKDKDVEQVHQRPIGNDQRLTTSLK
jgi:F0F1-type ATP synthase assembly protein I